MIKKVPVKKPTIVKKEIIKQVPVTKMVAVPIKKSPKVEPKVVETKATTKASQKTKDILLCKKTMIENKIFSAVIKLIGKSVDTAKNYDDFINLLKSNRYDLVMIDSQVLNLNLNELKDIFGQKDNLSSVIFVNKTENPDKFSGIFSEVANASINKAELQSLIKKFLK